MSRILFYVAIGITSPWAAAISATEFGIVWKPAASSWARAIALSSASLPLPNIVSAQGKVNEYAKKQKQSMQAYTHEDNISEQHKDKSGKSPGLAYTRSENLGVGKGANLCTFRVGPQEIRRRLSEQWGG